MEKFCVYNARNSFFYKHLNRFLRTKTTIPPLCSPYNGIPGLFSVLKKIFGKCQIKTAR